MHALVVSIGAVFVATTASCCFSSISSVHTGFLSAAWPYTPLFPCKCNIQLHLRCMAMALLQLLLLVGAVVSASAGADMFGQRFQGDGTYYGYRTRGFGHCSFHFHGFGTLPGYVGVPLAINAPQYKGPDVCGMCVKFRGTGPGAGGNPISSGFQDGFICDQCPECKFGDLDLQRGGDGRWRIEWYPVQCPVGSSTFRFGFQGGNPWYRKIMVGGTRVPVASVQLWSNFNSRWQPLVKTIDNYFEYHGDSGRDFSPCARVRITSIFGDTVEDCITCTSGTCAGRAQFPCKSNIAGGENCGRDGFNVNVNAFGLQLNLPGGVSGAFRPGQPLRRSGGGGVRPALDLRAARLDASQVTPSSTIRSGGQCGGLKFDCARYGSGACADKPFPGTKCGRGLRCVRNDANWWGCRKQ